MNDVKYYLALDIGTTSIKASILNEDFEIIRNHSLELTLCATSDGMIEFDAACYWEQLVASVNLLLKDDRDIADNICVITCSSCSENVIPVDVHGRPVRNAIIWYDSRAGEECDYILGSISQDEFYRNTGINELTACNPVCKMLWYKNHCPDQFCITHKFLQVEDFIVFKLTGLYVTDHSVSSSCGYFDINRNRYWSRIMDVIGVPETYLPDIKPSGEVVGQITPAVSAELGINPKALVSTGALDQICASVGSGNIKPGIISDSTGSAMAVTATVDRPDYEIKSKPLFYRHYNDQYMIIGLARTAGVVLKWFKDEFIHGGETGNAFRQMSEYACSVPVGSCGVMTIPYFLGRITSSEKRKVRGAFVGVSMDTRKEYFVRSIMEAVAYMLKENTEKLKDAGIDIHEIRSLGGASKSDIWNRIKANVCNVKIKTMQQYESATVGAAILGAKAIGMFGSVEEAVKKAVRTSGEYEPEPETVETYRTYYKRYLLLNRQMEAYFTQI